MAKNKKIKGQQPKSQKKVTEKEPSTENKIVAWAFDQIDKNGKFAFDISRQDFNIEKVVREVMAYSTMTWAQVRSQTHDKENRSKHHFVEFGKLSKEAQDRVEFMGIDKEKENVFSFAFDNLLRIIGIREGQVFHAIWFDPLHEFCPSHKKHT